VNGAAVKIHVGPSEGDQLALTHPGRERQAPQRLKLVTAGSLEDLSGLIGVEGGHLPPRDPRWIDQVGDVGGAAMFSQEFEAVFGDTENAVFLSDVVEAAFDPSIKPLFSKEK
jgi:hypothetical protein